MPHSRRRPAHRRQPNPRASWLITGYPTARILHEGQRVHLALAASRDHPKRYAPGQRLAVKPYVPAATELHVILTSVHGPRDAFTLGDITYENARELGYHRLDQFRIAWVWANDQDWLIRTGARTDGNTEEAMLERFEKRWAGKLAWLLRFKVDTTAAPRLLAARSDELYVENPAQAMRDEFPALTEEEWKTHVGPQSHHRRRERENARKAEREALGWPDRIDAARAAAKAKGYDIRDELRRFDRLAQNGLTDKAIRQLALIEQRVYPAAA